MIKPLAEQVASFPIAQTVLPFGIKKGLRANPVEKITSQKDKPRSILSGGLLPDNFFLAPTK